MSCDRSSRTWRKYFNGEMGEKDRVALDSHLTGCASCRKWMVSLEESRRLAIEALSVPAAINDSEWDTILEHLPVREPGRVVKLVIAFGTAAAALALLCVLWIAGPRGLSGAAADGGTAQPPQAAQANPEPGPDRYEVRLATSDPKVKIVWVFDRNLKLDEPKPGKESGT